MSSSASVISLATSIADIPLTSCVYNASGPRSGSIEALEKIASSASAAVLSKSATVHAQHGNPLPRYVNHIQLGSGYGQGSLNSEGLPNQGIDYYISTEALDTLGIKSSKPYMVSISGLSLEDNMTMLDKIYARCKEFPNSIAAIEVNLACPNIPNKPMVAYDFEQLDATLRRICTHPDFHLVPLGLKLAPYFDIPHFERVAEILVKYPIRFIVCTNTIGNALIVNAEKESAAIVPKEGLGGLGGGFIKHTALANVRMFYKLLQQHGRADIDIVGVGGIASGKDAFEFILCGAKAVQVGTCYWTEGPSCFHRISTELIELMKRKGYSSLEDFRGKLKPHQAQSSTSLKSSPEDDNNVFEEEKSLNLLKAQVKKLHMVIIVLLGIVSILVGIIMKR